MSIPALCPVAHDGTFKDIVTAVGLELGISIHSNKSTLCNWLAKGLSIAESFERSLTAAGLTPAAPLRYLIACLAPQVPTGSLIEYVERMLKLVLQGKWFFPVTAFDISLLTITFEDLITAHLPDVSQHLSSIDCSASALLSPLMQRLFAGSLPIAACCDIARACLAGQGGVALARAGCCLLVWHRNELLACQDMHGVTKVLAPSGRGKQQHSIRASLPNMLVSEMGPFAAGPFPVHLSASAAGVSPALGKHSSEAILGHAEFALHVRYLLHKNVMLSRVLRLPFGAPPLVRRGAPTVAAVAPSLGHNRSTSSNQLCVHVPSLHVLQLRSYHWVGFDLDHTLAQYNDALIAQHIVYAALMQLYSKFPADAVAVQQAAWKAARGTAAASNVTAGGVTRPASSSLASAASDTSADSMVVLPDCMQPQLPPAVVASLYRRYRAISRKAAPADGPAPRSRRGSMGGRGTAHRSSDAGKGGTSAAADALSASAGSGAAADSSKPFVLNSGPEPLWLHLCEAGVVLDRVLGNVLWVDSNAHVKLGFHGSSALGHEQLMAQYPASGGPGSSRSRSVSGTSAGSSTAASSMHQIGGQSATSYSAATHSVREKLPGLVPRLPGALFPPRQAYSPSDPTGGARFIVAHTGFDSPLAAVFALLVQESDAWAAELPIRPAVDYSFLFAAAAEAVRFTYTRFASQGFPAVLANVTPFLHMGDPPPASATAGRTPPQNTRRSMQSGDISSSGNVLPAAAYNKVPKAVKQAAGKALLSWLRDLRTSDVRRNVDGQPETAAGHVRTFLMTNADFEHARAVLCSLLGPDWIEAFDLVIVSARKKSMFEAAQTQLGAFVASTELTPFKAVDARSGRARALTKATLPAAAVPSVVSPGITPSLPHGRLVRVASFASPRRASRTSSLVSEGSDGGLSTGSDGTGQRTLDITHRRRTVSAERGAGGGLAAARIRSFDSQDSSTLAPSEHGPGASPGPRPSPLGAAAHHWSPKLRRLSRAEDFVPETDLDTFPGLGLPAVRTKTPPTHAAAAAATSSSAWGSSAGGAAAAAATPRSRLDRTRSMRSNAPPPLNLKKGILFAGGNIPQLLATMAESSGVRSVASLRVLYVGDHAATDVLLAGQLGWHTLAVSKRLAFAMAAEVCHKEHVAAAGAAATAAAASFVAPNTSSSGRRSSLTMAWMRGKTPLRPPAVTASERGLSAGHPLLLAHSSRNAGALSAGAQSDVRKRARTLSKQVREEAATEAAIAAALLQVGVSEPCLLPNATRANGGSAAGDSNDAEGANGGPSVELDSEAAADSVICDVMACRTWSQLPAYTWSEAAACLVTSSRGQAGRNVSRGRGLGQGQHAFWPLSVHTAASDVAVTGPDSPFGFCGASPTWVEGLALSSPNCKGVIPSVQWLARAMPLPSAKAPSSASAARGGLPLPRKQLSGTQPSGRGVVEMHALVRCDYGPDSVDTLTAAAVRQGCGFPEEMSFAFGMGAEPPPGMLRQAFTRCYSAVPLALERSPFAVQAVQEGSGARTVGPLRPPPTASDVLTAATTAPASASGVHVPWCGDMLLLHMRCSEVHFPWAQGLWRWHAAWVTSVYPWPQSDWSGLLLAPSSAASEGSLHGVVEDGEGSAHDSASASDADEGDPS